MPTILRQPIITRRTVLPPGRFLYEQRTNVLPLIATAAVAPPVGHLCVDPPFIRRPRTAHYTHDRGLNLPLTTGRRPRAFGLIIG